MVRRAAKSISVAFQSAKDHTVVDVGAGPGHYSVKLLEFLPADWKAILIDNYLDAGWFLRRQSETIRQRAHIYYGDHLVGLPYGAGVYLLGSMIHNLDDAGAAALLRTCAIAAEPDSRIMLVERVWNPSDLGDSSRDLDMQILFGGRERSDPELLELLTGAGFTVASFDTTADGYRIIVAMKDQDA